MNNIHTDISVLNSVYRGASVGSQAISDLLPNTHDSDFTADLQTQEREYVSISTEAANRLRAMGSKPEPVPLAKKAGMFLGVEMNAMMNNETDHLAELMIKGSNMGIINMTKVLNGYPDVTVEVRNLADKLIKTEQQNIDRLKVYLK